MAPFLRCLRQRTIFRLNSKPLLYRVANRLPDFRNVQTFLRTEERLHGYTSDAGGDRSILRADPDGRSIWTGPATRNSLQSTPTAGCRSSFGKAGPCTSAPRSPYSCAIAIRNQVWHPPLMILHERFTADTGLFFQYRPERVSAFLLPRPLCRGLPLLNLVHKGVATVGFRKPGRLSMIRSVAASGCSVGRFSAADIYLFMLTTCLRPARGHPTVDQFPNVRRIADAVVQIPGVQRVYEPGSQIQTTDSATAAWTEFPVRATD